MLYVREQYVCKTMICTARCICSTCATLISVRVHFKRTMPTGNRCIVIGSVSRKVNKTTKPPLLYMYTYIHRWMFIEIYLCLLVSLYMHYIGVAVVLFFVFIYFPVHTRVFNIDYICIQLMTKLIGTHIANNKSITASAAAVCIV